MKRLILCAMLVAVLAMASCQSLNAAPPTYTGNDTAVESQSEQTAELSAFDTVKRFFDYYNNRDSDAINTLVVEDHAMTLSEEGAATLTLIDCTQLQEDEDEAVVEVNFDVELAEINMTSFDEGLYTWRFFLIKDSEGAWRINAYGM